jgi:hypothetical protein
MGPVETAAAAAVKQRKPSSWTIRGGIEASHRQSADEAKMMTMMTVLKSVLRQKLKNSSLSVG